MNDFLKDEPRQVQVSRAGSMAEGFPDWRLAHPRVIVRDSERDEWDAAYRKLGPERLGRLYKACLARGGKCYLGALLEMLAEEQEREQAEADRGKREWRSYCASHERALRVLLLEPQTPKQKEWHAWLVDLWDPAKGAEEVYSTLVNGGCPEVWRELITSKVFPKPSEAACAYAKSKVG